MTFLKEIIQVYQSRSDFFIQLLVEHMLLVTIAIVIATVLGLSLGIWIAYYEPIAHLVLGFINFAYTIPTIAFFGLLMSVTGLGTKTALIVIVIYSLLPMTRNVYVGITQVDAGVLEAAKAMGSTTLQLLLKVQLPIALPVIIAGFRTMVVMVIAITSIAAFIGAGGLGVAIWRGITTNNMALTAAASALVALLAIVTDRIIGGINQLVTKKLFGK